MNDGQPAWTLGEPDPDLMTHTAIRIIKEEHAALWVVLRSILVLLAEHRREGTLPDFRVLRAMLFYIDEFPEKRHHRKESDLLFPMLRSRAPLHRDVLDHLDDDHRLGSARIRELEHALLEFEMMGDSRRSIFEEAAARYVDFYLDHMAMEEKVVLPLAERVLTTNDWSELAAAFLTNQDPLAAAAPDLEYGALFSRIVNATAARAGLGIGA